MIAEVPLGAFLSGGVDSSAVVGLMAGLSEKPVNTCSISFGDPKFNESLTPRKWPGGSVPITGWNRLTRMTST